MNFLILKLILFTEKKRLQFFVFLLFFSTFVQDTYRKHCAVKVKMFCGCELRSQMKASHTSQAVLQAELCCISQVLKKNGLNRIKITQQE